MPDISVKFPYIIHTLCPGCYNALEIEHGQLESGDVYQCPVCKINLKFTIEIDEEN